MPKKRSIDNHPYHLFAVPNGPNAHAFLKAVFDVFPPGSHLVPVSESDNARAHVTGQALRETMCAGLTPDFINQSLFANSCFLFAQLDKAPHNLLGLVSIKLVNDNQLYIDLICTNPKYSGLGTQFLNLLQEMARRSHRTRIDANAVNASVPFFVAKGFRKSARNNKKALTHVRLRVTKRRKAARSETKRTRKHPKTH